MTENGTRTDGGRSSRDIQREGANLDDSVAKRSQQDETSRRPADEWDGQYGADAAPNLDLETALIHLETEQKKNASLSDIIDLLREQLDTAANANQTFSTELCRLMRVQDEYEQKQKEWKKKEESFSYYLTMNHTRLLTLWKAVTSVRRQFVEMKSTAERDLTQIRREFNTASRDLSTSCFHLSTSLHAVDTNNQSLIEKGKAEKAELEDCLREKASELMKLQNKYDTQQRELNSKIKELTTKKEYLTKSLNDSERKLNDSLGNGNSSDWLVKSEIKFREMEELCSSLQNIAREVMADCEWSEEHNSDHRDVGTRLRSRTLLHERSVPLGHGSTSRSIDATCTLALVQETMQRRQQQVTDLRSRLRKSLHQIDDLKRVSDEVQHKRYEAETVVRNISDERDSLLKKIANTERTVEEYRDKLLQMDTERQRVEKLRTGMMQEVKDLTSENHRLISSVYDAQKRLDQLEDERDDISKEKDRLEKDLELCRKNICQSETKFANQLKIHTTALEALHSTQLAMDNLQQEKIEIGKDLKRVESVKQQLEIDLIRWKTENANQQGTIEKLQSSCAAFMAEINELTHLVKQLKEQKMIIENEKTSLEREMVELKDELLRIESENVSAETEITGLTHNLKLTETGRRQVEDELRQAIRAKNDLIDQLNSVTLRVKDVEQELSSSRKDLQRKYETNVRMNAECEQLKIGKNELLLKISSIEKESDQQNEALNKLRRENEAMQYNSEDLRQSKSLLMQSNDKLEKANKEERNKNYKISEQLQRLEQEFEKNKLVLEQQQKRYSELETELHQSIQQQRAAHEEDIEVLRLEKEQKITELKAHHEEQIMKSESQRAEQDLKYKTELEQVQETSRVNVERLEDLLREAENEKQNTLSVMEQEKAELADRLCEMEDELHNVEKMREKLERENREQLEKLLTDITILQGDLKKNGEKMEAMQEEHAERIKLNESEIKAAAKQRDSLLFQVAELNNRMRDLEKEKTGLIDDLNESNKKLRDVLEQGEISGREIEALRRALAQETFEKETLKKSDGELRNTVKNIEAERIELKRTVKTLTSKINELEERNAALISESSRLGGVCSEAERSLVEARHNLEELQHLLQESVRDKNKLYEQFHDLQARLASDDFKEEEIMKKNYALKQKVIMTEAGLEAMRKELCYTQRKLSELEDESKIREKSHQMAITESHQNGRRIEEARHNLELELRSSEADLSSLRSRFKTAEGKTISFAENLSKVEREKQKAEYQLSSIVALIETTIAFAKNKNWSGARGSLRFRSPSPTRMRIPRLIQDSGRDCQTTARGRSASPRKDVSVPDVDVDAMRASLRQFMQNVMNIEREKGESLQCVQTLTEKLDKSQKEKETEEQSSRQLQRALSDALDDKRKTEDALKALKTAIEKKQSKREQLEKESTQKTENISNLQRLLSQTEAEKRQLQDAIKKLEDTERKHEDKKQEQRKRLEEAESRVADDEQIIKELERDLQRAKLCLKEREENFRQQEAKNEEILQQFRDSELKALTLNSKVAQLNESLSKTQEEEKMYKIQIDQMKKQISDGQSTLIELEDRISRSQKALTDEELKTKSVQERYAATRETLEKSRNRNHEILEQNQKLQSQLDDVEACKREMAQELDLLRENLHEAKVSEEDLKDKLEIVLSEKQNLVETVAVMKENITNLEERRVEFEKKAIKSESDHMNLVGALEKMEKRLKAEMTKSKEQESLMRSLQTVSQENVDLQSKVKDVQTELQEAQSTHEQRLVELTNGLLKQKNAEIEQLKGGLAEREKLLETKERVNRHRLKNMDDQVKMLKEELEIEIRKRQQFLLRSDQLLTGNSVEFRQSLLDISAATNLGRMDPSDVSLSQRNSSREHEDFSERMGTGTALVGSLIGGPSPRRYNNISL